MRIAVASESFVPRADEVADTARHLVEGLLVRGHDVVVVIRGPGAASYRGARVLRSRSAVPAAPGAALDAFRPDLLVAVAPRVLGSGCVRHARRRGLPTLAIDPPPVHARAGRTLATSVAHRTRLTVAGVDTELWSPGVDLAEHHPALRDERLRTAWAKGNALVVGHVGEIGKEKVVDRLARIALMDGVRLVVFGDGPGAAELRAAGAKVTGATTGLELARGIASLDALVQPRKKQQAVPAVRRALASGVPVVGFDAGGTRDVVVHGHNGLLADPAHGKELRRAVRALADDPDLRARLAGHARDSVADRPWDSAVGELCDQHLPAFV
jgi:phosphatidylinositol alpha 1,6-mannosyltransferase